MEILTRPHRTHFPQWAADKPEVLVLSADLTSSCEADLFRETHPDRFLTMAMAEQNMMSFAGGLAREGLSPWVHTFAVFITRRPFDQVAMSIAYPNLPVRLLGFLPGLTTPGGATHQAIEDVALMRALPNMTVVDTGDATEVLSFPDAVHALDGPVYVRVLRGLVPRLFSTPLELGRCRVLGRGQDLTLVSSGICTEQALRVTQGLRQAGVDLTHLHVSTLKPFDDPQVIEAVCSARQGVITMENHSLIGGLGSAVAEVMAEHGAASRLVRLGVRDVFAHGASREHLLAEYGLDAHALVRAVEGLLGAELDVQPVDLESLDDVDRVEDL